LIKKNDNIWQPKVTSKKVKLRGIANGNATHEQITIGCLQRIASATEKMSQRYTDMERDLDWYKKRHLEHGAIIQRLVRSNNALRGHINRMKRLK
jgi:hypothetical protein